MTVLAYSGGSVTLYPLSIAKRMGATIDKEEDEEYELFDAHGNMRVVSGLRVVRSQDFIDVWPLHHWKRRRSS